MKESHPKTLLINLYRFIIMLVCARLVSGGRKSIKIDERRKNVGLTIIQRRLLSNKAGLILRKACKSLQDNYFCAPFLQKRNIGPSSNGRTTDFGSVYVGSNPAGPTTKSASRKRADFLFFKGSQACLKLPLKNKK